MLGHFFSSHGTTLNPNRARARSIYVYAHVSVGCQINKDGGGRVAMHIIVAGGKII